MRTTVSLDDSIMHDTFCIEVLTMRRTLVVIAFALAAPFATAAAQGRVRHEARDLRVARHELARDTRERRADLRSPFTTRRELARDGREIRRDKLTVRQERRDLTRALHRRRH